MNTRPLSKCCKIDVKIENDNAESEEIQGKKIFTDNLLKQLLEKNVL